MTAYLLYWSTPAKARILRFENRVQADSYPLSLDQNGFTIVSESDLQDSNIWKRPLLVSVYNALATVAGKPTVTTFSSTAIGQERLYRFITTEFHNIPFTKGSPMEDIVNVEATDIEATETKATETKATETKATKATKEPATKATKEPATKATKEPATTEESVKRHPGVISELIAKLRAGGGTVSELFDHLKATFPDRGEGMLTTVKVQLQALPKRAKDPLTITKVKLEDGHIHYSIEG